MCASGVGPRSAFAFAGASDSWGFVFILVFVGTDSEGPESPALVIIVSIMIESISLLAHASRRLRKIRDPCGERDGDMSLGVLFWVRPLEQVEQK